MRRLTRQEIETTISVRLATADKLVEQRLRSKLTSDRDWARKELAKAIADQLDNEHSMVVVTTVTVPHGYYSLPGKWGVDEAAPC